MVVDDSDDVDSKANSSDDEVCRIDDSSVTSKSDLIDKSSDLVGSEMEKTGLDIDIKESSNLVGGELDMGSEVGGDIEKLASKDGVDKLEVIGKI